MKRKVQAQRKFALGAHVPNISERRQCDQPAPSSQDSLGRDEHRNVYFNSMSAHKLLDLVSTQNIHHHFKPVVLLERLQPKTVSNIKMKAVKVVAVKSAKRYDLRSKPRMVNIRKMGTLRNHRKSNLSKKHDDKTPNKSKTIVQQKPDLKKRRLISVLKEVQRPKLRRIQPRTMSDFSIDDEKPLKFFANNVTTRAKSKCEKSNIIIRTDLPGNKTAELVVGSISVKISDNAHKTHANSLKETLPKDPDTGSVQNSYHKNSTGTGYYGAKQIERWINSAIATHSNDTGINCEPSFKTPFPRRKRQEEIRVNNSAESLNTEPTLSFPVPVQQFSPIVSGQSLLGPPLQSLPGQSPQSSPVRSLKSLSIVSQQPFRGFPRQLSPVSTRQLSPISSRQPSPGPSRQPSPGPSRQPSPCPSERYHTVEDVVHAPHHDLNKKCKGDCIRCSRVQTVKEISSLFSKQGSRDVSNSNDIYDFDAEKAQAIDSTGPSEFKRQSRTGSRVSLKSSSDDETNEEPYYLDLLPGNSEQIIQIMSVKIPNQEKRMMRARLVTKSDINSSQSKLSFIKHEILLDKLFQRFRNINNRDKSGDNQTHTRELDQNMELNSHQGKSAESDGNIELEQPDKPDNYILRATDNLNTGNDLLDVSVTNISEQPYTEENAVAKKATIKRSEVTQDPRTQSEPSTSRTLRHTIKKTNKESTNTNQFKTPKVSDAPVFYPTETEFMDPIAYFQKIIPLAAKSGLCKVVAPEGFKPTCTLNDEIKFAIINQYISRLYDRWGTGARIMCGIKASLLLSRHSISVRPPLVEGVEVNLPKLFRIVQENGGLNSVIEKKRWGRVCEQMRFTKCTNPEKKLDQIYVKYILPYATLSVEERHQILKAVELCWHKKNQKMLDRAKNPLHRQMRLLGEADSSEEETEDDLQYVDSLAEAEDCVVPGRRINLATFKKVATNVMQTHFPSTSEPSTQDVKKVYWSIVLKGIDHVCVNTASIDTGDEGYGFTKHKNDTYGKHPWNLKMLSQNNNNILRSLGPVLGVTVPTLHLGMVFSTSCWHRDPHGLPWIEYMHTGPGKIWYGIPDDQSKNFRRAVETLCPSYCQNKSIWLPSDIAMIPPNLLMEHNVSLSSVVQKPREFIIVIPKAYSCSISTGYTVSESVYFATNSWLNTVHHVFQELRDSCEPTMFSLEQLLIAAARDTRVSLSVLQQINTVLTTIITDELANRQELYMIGVQTKTRSYPKKRSVGNWNVRDQDECDFCRSTLYLSKVTGLTNKKSSMCLQHALRLLEKPTTRHDMDLSTLDLVTYFSPAELENIMKYVNARLSVI